MRTLHPPTRSAPATIADIIRIIVRVEILAEMLLKIHGYAFSHKCLPYLISTKFYLFFVRLLFLRISHKYPISNNNNNKCLYCPLDKNTYPMLQDKKIKSSAKLQ